jgi:two-component system OmpR family response regulator
VPAIYPTGIDVSDNWSYTVVGEPKMPGSKILVAEDDQTLLDSLRYNLTKEGYRVIAAADGTQALAVARSEKPALIILDTLLPELSGLEVCRILRRETTLPILMLTTKDEETDRIVGLEIGADDYMTKPFNIKELLARIRAILRRAEIPKEKIASEEPLLQVNDLEIDIARRRAVMGESLLDLRPKEFDLLAFLAENRGIVFGREQLLEKVWGYKYPGNTRTVDVHIRWLREKIEDASGKPERLITVRGVGYKLEG